MYCLLHSIVEGIRGSMPVLGIMRHARSTPLPYIVHYIVQVFRTPFSVRSAERIIEDMSPVIRLILQSYYHLHSKSSLVMLVHKYGGVRRVSSFQGRGTYQTSQRP